MHIDAAYAGSAFICPEFRPLLNGIEVGSIIYNATALSCDHFGVHRAWPKNFCSCRFNIFQGHGQPVSVKLVVEYLP